MTVSEAKAILNVDDLELLEDVFEEAFFQSKKQILEIIPIRKLIDPKLKKLNQLQVAYQVLGGEIEEGKTGEKDEVEFSNVMIDSFNKYQTQKNRLRLKLFNALSPNQVFLFGESLVELELRHAFLWNDELKMEMKTLLKAPDPMEVLMAIKVYKENGGITFDDLKEGKNNPPQLLIEEKNRLSLLYQKYGNHE